MNIAFVYYDKLQNYNRYLATNIIKLANIYFLTLFALLDRLWKLDKNVFLFKKFAQAKHYIIFIVSM